ncbi:hypothetical protein [Streptomyces sp. NBC_00233]|uniref:hypothetical protein n=1 Tax=Streptomyces sp. NBC_00233 TaxID=2975686 RepID=UPI00224FEC4E|nr:hypothetical protein [Streptomyces sp. NBC_00233]MCX5231241.1 hypothetical protein [Streptomyces sp. NBC_00233]
MNPPPAAESGCQMMKRLAKEQAKSIDTSEERAEEFRKRITELEAQANPDQAQISALKQALAHLEKKIEDDRVTLSDLESVISENC